MKKFLVLLGIGVLLGGCGMLSPTSNNNDSGRNQYDAHVEGVESVMEMVEDLIDSAAMPTVVFTTRLDDQNKPVTTTEVNVGSAIIASKFDNVVAAVAQTKVPETGFAQGLRAAGDATAKIASAPGTIALGMAHFTYETAVGVAALAGTDNRTYVYKDVNGSFNDTKAVGSGTSTGPTVGVAAPEPSPESSTDQDPEVAE
ncbi:MAG: hypothetical protein OEM02_17015 [Desulfobulbaceae bacterium]|nr:hypothetical protein [Desulfobulbaceae bacterium]